jgi:5'-3' exonuclease
MSRTPLLLVLDFSNLLHRALHALSYQELTNSAGEPIHAAYGATSQALRLIERYNPTHVVAALDSSRANLRRREISSDYKANRPTERDETIDTPSPTTHARRSQRSASTLAASSARRQTT